MYKLSIIVPAYNESANIAELHKQLTNTLGEYNRQILFVDDGSTDNTVEVLKALCQTDSSVSFISLSRNFGHQQALKAGFDHAIGDAVICMDADLQHPVSIIPKMIDLWLEGFEVVNTIREEQQSLSWKKRFASRSFYKIINLLSDVPVKQGAADFRLLDRKVVNALIALPENTLFFRGLIPWLGFKQTTLNFTPNKRNAGETKYSLSKMISLAINGISSFSIRPLYLSMVIGLIIAGLAFIYGLYALYVFLFSSATLPGWTSILASILFIGGIQLIMIGIIGGYVGKMFIETKHRPVYIIRESLLNTQTNIHKESTNP